MGLYAEPAGRRFRSMNPERRRYLRLARHGILVVCRWFPYL